MDAEDSYFHVELTAVVDGLLKAAVVEICALADRWRDDLRMEITTSKIENEQLKRKLQIMEENLSVSRVAVSKNVGHHDKNTQFPEAGTYPNDDCGNVETELTVPKGNQWMQQCRFLPGVIKVEAMEISVTAKAGERLFEKSSNVLHPPHYTNTETSNQLLEFKTECKSNTEPEVQMPEAESREDIGTECEDETQDSTAMDGECETMDHKTQNVHLTQSKTKKKDDTKGAEVQEQPHLVAAGIKTSATSILNISEPSTSDCSVCVILGETAEVSTLPRKAKHSKKGSKNSPDPLERNKKKGLRLICHVCGKSLSTKYSLKVHLTLHTGDRPHVCMQCGKRFVNKTNLQIHQNIHTGEKPYVCTLCPKSFSDPSPLARHERMHRREREGMHRREREGMHRRELEGKHSLSCPKPKFMCNICGKILSTKQGLTYHITVHTGKRPFTCTWCGKSFVLRSNLLIHQNIHTGVKPYICTLCQKSYADPSSLTKHKRLHK